MSSSARYSGPAELTVRVTAADAQLIERLYGLHPSGVRAPYRPDRLVVDAHVPTTPGGAELSLIAREVGIPFLVDPETYYLQDFQHTEAPWCATPFGQSGEAGPSDLISPSAQLALVQSVVGYQIAHGATAVIAPYVHIDRPTPGWLQVQAGLWRRTASYIREAGINLPVIAVVAIGWRCLHPTQGVPALGELWEGLTALGPDEVALAASKVHDGVEPAGRIAELLMLVTRLAQAYPKVTMWQQGLLGEVCVVQGAAGYECGIGWREKCDLQTRETQHRYPTDGHPGARPVYVQPIGRSVSKKRLELASTRRRTWAQLVCPYPDCCAPAGADLLQDARLHAVVTRARELASLDSSSATRWRWNSLAQRYAQGIALADLLNAVGPSSSQMPEIQMRSLVALRDIANARRGRPGLTRRTA